MMTMSVKMRTAMMWMNVVAVVAAVAVVVAVAVAIHQSLMIHILNDPILI